MSVEYKRTSVLLRPNIWRSLKIVAATKEKTVSELLNDILENELMR